MEQKEASDHKRRDLVIILIILLIGFLCVIVAGEQAARFAPRWKMDTSMGSNIDPNSDFLTSRPVNFIEPLDASILTQPAWINVFLTPGASYRTSTPVPTTTTVNTLPPATQTRTPVATLIATNTLPVIASPTKTPIYYPPSTPTSTSVPGASADLRITMSDGSSTYIVGGTRTYTITVYNLNGPSNLNGATVIDNFPAELSGITWTCIATGGATCTANGTGNINTSVNLPAGSSVTFTANANVNPAATGNLVNTATVTLPASVTDPTLANNTVTDTDTPVFNADLLITMTDGSTTYVVGGISTYTITVYNLSGPSNVNGATVVDNFPAELSGIAWTCSATGGGTCTANGAGNIKTSVNLPVGSSVTFTANANVSPAATGNLVNTATVALPVGVTDPALANNTVTDTNTPVFNVDLQITKTDGVTSYVPGTSVTYTIAVTNTGLANVTGATITDTFPVQVSSVTWSCVSAGSALCTANGIGNINDIVSIPTGGSLTYTAVASIASSATGSLSNTASIALPSGYINTGNNSATDIDTSAPSADLRITKTDNSTDYIANATKIYIITVSNAGPSDVIGAIINDSLPTQIISWDWVCTTVINAGNCDAVTGSASNFTDTINIQSGGSVVYTVTAKVSSNPSGSLVNTATVTAPGGVTDPGPGLNSMDDTDNLIVPDTLPGQIGTTPNANWFQLMSGNALTLNMTVVADGDIGVPDLVYYEIPNGSGIWLDWMQVEIGDGSNWYTVFYWGDDIRDTNSNVDYLTLTIPVPPTPPFEVDQQEVNSTDLYNKAGYSTGIAIDIDAIAPAGTYSFIRFTAPSGDLDGQSEIDALEILP